jgi:hypothetical protein
MLVPPKSMPMAFAFLFMLSENESRSVRAGGEKSTARRAQFPRQPPAFSVPKARAFR